jgi:hypothetical protein
MLWLEVALAYGDGEAALVEQSLGIAVSESVVSG